MQKSIIAIQVQNGNIITLFLEHSQDNKTLLEVLNVIFNFNEEASMEMINEYFNKSEYKYNFLSRGIFENEKDIPKIGYESLFFWNKKWQYNRL